MESNKDEISRCYFELYRCMIKKDTKGLERLLDEKFMLVHMAGMKQSKREFLRCIADSILNYYSCDDTRQSITIDGEKAHCTGKSKVNAAVFGGLQHTWNLQLDIDFRKENGHWLITKARASNLKSGI